MLLRRQPSNILFNLTVLVFSFGSGQALLTRNERSPDREQVDTNMYLPDNFMMSLSLKGEANQFDASMLFNKTTFGELYNCLCGRNTLICSGNITYIFGTSYKYNVGHIKTTPTNTSDALSSTYKCEIPNFGFLANNGGGNFNCRRVDNSDRACSTTYWAIYIGTCDLQSADVIWNKSHKVSWSYSVDDSKANRKIVSECVCDEYGGSNCSSSPTTAADTPETTVIYDNTTAISSTELATGISTQSPTKNTTVISSAAHLVSVKETDYTTAIIIGVVSAVIVILLLIAGLIWRYRWIKQRANYENNTTKGTANGASKLDNRDLSAGLSRRLVHDNFPYIFALPVRGLKPDSFYATRKHSCRDDDDAASSIYDVIGSGIYENDIGVNDSSSSNDNNNNSSNNDNSGVKIRIDKPVGNNNDNANNKSAGYNMSSDSKIFSLTVTNSDNLPGNSRFSNKDNNVHSSQKQFLKPNVDVKSRQRQPLPVDESSTASQNSSAYSLGRHFQENYNFLNRPAEAFGILSSNSSNNNSISNNSISNLGQLAEPVGQTQNSTVSFEFVYPFNTEALLRHNPPTFQATNLGFPYSEASESGETLPTQGGC